MDILTIRILTCDRSLNARSEKGGVGPPVDDVDVLAQGGGGARGGGGHRGRDHTASCSTSHFVLCMQLHTALQRHSI